MVYTAENVSKVVFYEYNLPLLRQSGIVNFISVLLNDQECQPVTFCCVDLFYQPRSGMVMRRCNLVVVDAFSFKFFQGEVQGEEDFCHFGFSTWVILVFEPYLA